MFFGPLLLVPDESVIRALDKVKLPLGKLPKLNVVLRFLGMFTPALVPWAYARPIFIAIPQAWVSPQGEPHGKARRVRFGNLKL